MFNYIRRFLYALSQCLEEANLYIPRPFREMYDCFLDDLWSLGVFGRLYNDPKDHIYFACLLDIFRF